VKCSNSYARSKTGKEEVFFSQISLKNASCSYSTTQLVDFYLTHGVSGLKRVAQSCAIHEAQSEPIRLSAFSVCVVAYDRGRITKIGRERIVIQAQTWGLPGIWW